MLECLLDMNSLFQSRPYTDEERRSAVLNVIDNATPDRDFYLLTVGAALFALCGIALDSIPVLIGAMIVAPLASPILALALGFATKDMQIALRSFGVLVLAMLVATVVASIFAHFLPPFTINGTYISFIAHPFYDLAIALIAGAIASYGQMRVKVGNALTGIGIAVSLMPPLIASAIALGRFDVNLFYESALIFLLNVAGILVGSFIVFVAFRITTRHQ
ncbi:MAG: hypothetical protein Greene07147_165 [Parcubacteria group bacterium Greene0714_7]|nr:MAG: hypothetical protein Greene07147_165 [Parcubacteria group bacterium Greene0714_7]